jgi:hypothetical protein
MILSHDSPMLIGDPNDRHAFVMPLRLPEDARMKVEDAANS